MFVITSGTILSGLLEGKKQKIEKMIQIDVIGSLERDR